MQYGNKWSVLVTKTLLIYSFGKFLNFSTIILIFWEIDADNSSYNIVELGQNELSEVIIKLTSLILGFLSRKKSNLPKIDVT